MPVSFVLLLLATLLFIWSSFPKYMGVSLWAFGYAGVAYGSAVSLLLKRRIIAPALVRELCLIVLLSVGWFVIIDLVTRSDSLLSQFARLSLGIAIALAIYSLLGSVWRIKVFTHTLIFAASISAAVALMQYFVGGPFLDLWELARGQYADPQVKGLVLDRLRVAGLTDFSIRLASQLSSLIPIVVSFVAARSMGTKARLIQFVALLVLLGGLTVTFTRSAYLGAAVGTIIVLPVRKGRRKLIMVICLMLLLAICYIALGLSAQPHLITFTNNPTMARIPLALAALYVVKDHPFGVGTDQLIKHTPAYYQKLRHWTSAHAILDKNAHNQFLNVLAFYGVPGFLLLVTLYMLIFRMLGRTRESDHFLKSLSVGLVGSFAGYIVNSMFHNAGPFIGDTFHWLLIGLSLAVYKVARVQNSIGGADGAIVRSCAPGLPKELFHTDGDIQR